MWDLHGLSHNTLHVAEKQWVQERLDELSRQPQPQPQIQQKT